MQWKNEKGGLIGCGGGGPPQFQKNEMTDKVPSIPLGMGMDITGKGYR